MSASFNDRKEINCNSFARPSTCPPGGANELRTPKSIRCISASPGGRFTVDGADPIPRTIFIRLRPRSVSAKSLTQRSLNPSAIEQSLEAICTIKPGEDLTQKSVFTLAREAELTERLRATSAPPHLVQLRNLDALRARRDSRPPAAPPPPDGPSPPRRVRATSPHLLTSRHTSAHVVAHHTPLSDKLDLYRRDPRALAQLQRRVAALDSARRSRAALGGGAAPAPAPASSAAADHVRRNVRDSAAGAHRPPAQSELLRHRALDAALGAALHRAARRRLLADGIDRTQAAVAAREARRLAMRAAADRRSAADRAAAVLRVLAPALAAAARGALWAAGVDAGRRVREQQARVRAAARVLLRCFRAVQWKVRARRAARLRRFLRPRVWRALLWLRVRRRARHAAAVARFLRDARERRALFARMRLFRAKVVRIQRFVKVRVAAPPPPAPAPSLSLSSSLFVSVSLCLPACLPVVRI